MANNFNDNTNKKNLNGNSISYTTYRTNYSNDEMMKENGGVPNGKNNKNDLISLDIKIKSINLVDTSNVYFLDENENILNIDIENNIQSINNLIDKTTSILYCTYSSNLYTKKSNFNKPTNSSVTTNCSFNVIFEDNIYKILITEDDSQIMDIELHYEDYKEISLLEALTNTHST